MPSDAGKLAPVRSFSDLLAFLERELGWPMGQMRTEELVFEFDPRADLGLAQRTSAAIRSVRQLRPLTVTQPFGIFFVEFEARYLPVGVMHTLLRALVTRKAAASNPAARKTWERDDLLFISASGGGDARRIDFAHFAGRTQGDAQDLRVLGWHPGEPRAKLEWVETELRRTLRWPETKDPDAWRSQWRQAFDHRPARERGAWVDLDASRREALIKLYTVAEMTVDALPYTPDFDWMVEAFNASTDSTLTHHDFWRALSSARKTGQLPRKQR